MGFMDRIFGRGDPQTDFARHILVLAKGTHNIQLGIYWRLSKKHEKQSMGVDPYHLKGTVSLGDFPKISADLIQREVWQAGRDEKIRNAPSFEYAGRLMAISWLSGGPLSEEYQKKANVMIAKATALGFEITNIKSLWGSKAIVNLYSFSEEFRQQNV